MFSSAELIEALRRRMRRSLRPPPPPGEYPPGWREWFADQAARQGQVTGAPATEVIAAAAERRPVLPPRPVEQLGRWRAFTTLWRQDWQPATRDERWPRVTAMSGSLLLHLLVIAALVLLMAARFYFPVAEEDARDGEQHVLQVEYIGEGTPRDAGGGATGGPPAPEDTPAPSTGERAAAAESTAIAPETPPLEQPPVDPVLATETAPESPPPLPLRELTIQVPELEMPALPLPQDLQVTEVEVADSRFAVPPPRDVAVATPEAAAPDVAVRRREIELETRETPVVPTVRTPPGVELSAPRVSPRGVAVVEREVELAEARAPTVASTRQPAPVSTPDIRAPAPSAQARTIPMPSARVASQAADNGTAPAGQSADAGQARASSARSAPGTAAAVSPPAGRPEPGSGARAAGPAAGAGRQPGQPPGALPSAAVSDDWGDSTREVPGGQAGTPGASGLFNADGSPRLAGDGRVGGGLPPGTITEDFENIDRHGTWLKRPPYDYEPTAFDRFWMPSETLLEEWVRKSVTEVRIPIPGTTKSIRCMTVLLAMGGACSIFDPNLQEQAAGARPPPDVPFKPELQEARDSLGSPPGS